MIKERQALFILLALSAATVLDGCVHPPAGAREPTSVELAAIHRADGDFREQIEEIDHERCDDRFAVRILVTEGQDFEEQSTYCNPGPWCDPQDPTRPTQDCPNGCARATVTTWRDGVWPWVFISRSWKPLIVLWSGIVELEERLLLIRHEWMHWIMLCQDGDPDRLLHERRDVWRLVR